MAIFTPIKNRPIAKKFSLPLILYVAGLTLISLTVVIFVSDFRDRDQLIIDLTIQKNILSRLEADLATSNEGITQLLYFNNHEYNGNLLAIAEDFQSVLVEFKEISQKHEFINDASLADEVDPTFDELRIYVNRIISLVLNNRTDEASKLFQNYYLIHVKRIRLFSNEVLYGKSDLINKLLSKSRDHKVLFIFIFSFELIITLLIIFLLHRKIAKQIITPINNLKISADAIIKHYSIEGEGEDYYIKASAYLKKNDSNDEIGILTQHFTSMLKVIEARTVEVKKAKEIAEKANSQLRILANNDPLTNLYNRRMLTECIQHALALAERNNHCIGLFYLDLDDFKKVNDSYGHSAGDELLIQVSKRLKILTRESDILARIGGDEFVLLVEKVEGLSFLTDLAERIIQIFETAFEIDEQLIYVSCSVGIATYPEAAKTVEELIRNADTALYKAKAKGRNCYRYYSELPRDEQPSVLD